MKKEIVNIGLIGCGTVGMGVVKILQKNIGILEEKAGTRLRLTWICDKRKIPVQKYGVHAPQLTDDWRQLAHDPELDIVIELIGGYEPARTIVLESLKAGKHVATANKAMLAKYWGEVFTTAQKSHALVYFEASVGGGIPVIQGINEGLAGNHIEKIYGILNGTTNYVLTRMNTAGIGFSAALKEAQQAGFAEADPTFDIQGVDAAHKIVILASLASNGWVHLDDVYCEGIEDLDVWDVRFAQERFGLCVKLLGISRLSKKRHCTRVHPVFIPCAHPFAAVNHEYNAVFAHGDAAGDVMFYGKGAGQMSAASAVVSDMVYLARQAANGTAGQIPCVSYHEHQKLEAIPFHESKCRHYLRFTTVDKPGVLAKISGILSEAKISIASVSQEDPSLFEDDAKQGVRLVIVTHEALEGAVQSALKTINQLPVLKKKAVHIRIEELK